LWTDPLDATWAALSLLPRRGLTMLVDARRLAHTGRQRATRTGDEVELAIGHRCPSQRLWV